MNGRGSDVTNVPLISLTVLLGGLGPQQGVADRGWNFTSCFSQVTHLN